MTEFSEADQFISSVFLEKGVADRSQIRECLKLKAQYREEGGSAPPLGEIMVEKGYVSPDVVRTAHSLYDKKVNNGNGSNGTSGHNEGLPVIPGYEIEEEIGQGSMGTVYRARQKSLDRPVAIKILSEGAKRDTTYLKRFRREARYAARFNHVNIINGIDVGTHDDTHYFVMEYVEGETLDYFINENGPLPVKMATDIVKQITRALYHTDQHSMVHRDIKPENIMLSKKGKAKLCDLGLAKNEQNDPSLTMAGTTVGTPYYMSPEQVQGDQIDIRSDIYSLGVTLYHALVGDVPFDAPSPAQVMTRQVEDHPTPPSKHRVEVGGALDEIVLTMMAKDPDQRYRTPEDLLDALDNFEEHHQSNPEQPSTKPLKRVHGQKYFTSSPVTMSSRSTGSNYFTAALIISTSLALMAFFLV